MAWSIDRPSEKLDRALRIEPLEVLYDFDGPQLFKARFGFFESIFVKLDEFANTDLWLCSVTDDRIMELLRKNMLSVRGAFLSDRTWVVATDHAMTVERYWACSLADLTEEMLPSSGIGLHGSGRVPDTVV